VIAVLDRTFVGEDAAWLRLAELVIEHATARPWLAVQLRVKDLSVSRQRSLLLQLPLSHPRLLLNGAPTLDQLVPYQHLTEHRLRHGPRCPTALTASVHALASATTADHAGVAALLFAPVWAPGSKPGTGRGTDALRSLCRKTALPIYALGGVHEDRVPVAIEAGAAGVASLSAVCRTAAPRRVLDALFSAVDASLVTRGDTSDRGPH
jgi:hypothetical protein